MPLTKGKSPEAFKHNIKAEMAAGKPLKQSLAIAYSMKRKKMAKGGMVDMTKEERMAANHGKAPTDYGPNEEMEDKEGQKIPNGQLLDEYYGSKAHPEEHEMDIVDRIMNKRKMHSEGGMIANGGEDEMEHLADHSPNNFDDLSLRDDLESTNSGINDGDLLGNKEQDEERNDIISKIMRQRKMKQSNPRPA